MEKGEAARDFIMEQFNLNRDTIRQDRSAGTVGDALQRIEGYNDGEILAPEIHVVPLDLAVLDSVRAFPDRLREQGIDHIDVLMNNAAEAMLPNFTQTVDGFELQFQTNHLGPFLLVHELLDFLDCSGDMEMVMDPKKGEEVPFYHRTSRIVNVTCKLFRFARLLENWNDPESYEPSIAYANSKLANVVFTYELQSRVKDMGILVNCCDPGVANTELRRHMTQALNQKQVEMANNAFKKIGAIQTPEEAAKLQTYLAVSPDVEGVGGNFYSRSIKPSLSGKESYRVDVANRLWKMSVEALKLE